jgi:amidohydrolase
MVYWRGFKFRTGGHPMGKRVAGFRKKNIFVIAGILSMLMTAPAWSDPQKIIATIDQASSGGRVVSQKIWEYREPGQKEFKSSALLMEELRKLGFTVTGNLKVPADLSEDKDGISKTAFRAELQGKGPGPTITIMLEYDALPNGHSCGHNLISTSGLLAAAGLSKVMGETPGRIVVVGTPDEERGSMGMGKVALLEGGHFDGSDIVLITHPFDRWNTETVTLAMKRATFVFKGKSAHAAASPHLGVNALRAVLQTFNNVDSLREHLRQDVRIHGIIKKGGEAVNIVPEMAEAEFAVRALDTTTMEETYKKVVNSAKAAELVTGAKLEFKEPRSSLKAPVRVPYLIKMVLDRARTLGVPESDIIPSKDLGSSDLGNVANTYPTVELKFKIATEGVPNHSDAFREAAATDEGWKSTVIAGKTLALTAYELLTHPEKVKSIQDQFKEMKAKEGK